MRQFALATDPYNLERFITAQQRVIDTAMSELRNGHKTSHWMWFIFPQLRGLGRSSDAHYYGISSQSEALAYLQHPTLGLRLLDCTRLTNSIPNRSAEQVFGGTDALKFRSCITLFSLADPTQECFTESLDKFYAGEMDPLTLELLGNRQC